MQARPRDRRARTHALAARLLLLQLLLLLAAGSTATPPPPFRSDVFAGALPTTANCTQLWMEQRVDHFDLLGGVPTWLQRFYACPQFYESGPRAPLIFYAGNEGALPGRINTTGAPWELAHELGGLLVWAEHRHYGSSIPVPGAPTNATAHRYLTIEQALTDYIRLIRHVKDAFGIPDAPVVAIGGSYGGNLAAWLRMRYPEQVYAALASSAPLRSNLVDGQGWDPASFWQVVSRTASPLAGAAPGCVPNSRAAFAALADLARSEEGRAQVGAALRLCEGVLATRANATTVALWLRNAFDTAAMSSYAYPSSYFTGDPMHPLPAWPMRAACEELAGDLSDAEELLSALGRAASVVWNATADKACYDTAFVLSGAWQTGSSYVFQVCTQFVPDETFFPSNASSMFWDEGRADVDVAAIDAFCQQYFEEGAAAPTPDFTAVPLLLGVNPGTSSNIILFNGLLDPWSSGGYLEDLSDTVVAVVDPHGGHHADLQWDSPHDPPSLRAARRTERRLLAQWLAAYQPGVTDQ